MLFRERILANLIIQSDFSFTNILNKVHDICLIFFQVRAKDPFQFDSILTDGSSKGERVGDHFIDCTPRVVEQISSVSRHVDI